MKATVKQSKVTQILGDFIGGDRMLCKQPVHKHLHFTPRWIGVFEKEYRNRCIALGEKQNCTKGKWSQKVVILTICVILSRLIATIEICKGVTKLVEKLAEEAKR